MPTPTTLTSPLRITELRNGPWEPLTENPVLEVHGREIVVSCPQVTVHLTYTPAPGYVDALPAGRWTGEPRSLDGVPSHRDPGPGLQRFAFQGTPMPASVHQILDTDQMTGDYCDIHTHPEAAEVNVLIPGDPRRPLEFDLYNEGPLVGIAPMTLWVPAGAEHSATARAGTGFFVMLRVPLA